MREFFNINSGASEDVDLAKRGKKARGSRSYLPQKDSAAYALLISLHRATVDGAEFMHKQELIEAAEASGLSQVRIAPEKERAKPGQFGGSPKDWYSGWSAMRTLISNNLICKTSCPAKYTLSDKGRSLALDCLSRSGMLDSVPNVDSREESSDSDNQDVEIMEFVAVGSPKSSDLNTKKGMKDDIPVEFLERDYHEKKASQSFFNTSQDVLRLPPLEDLQKFEEAYKVVLILDDREGFIRTKSSSKKKLIKNICDEFKIQTEVQRLPVGDAVWIARHKQLSNDYVLDFIVERKNVEDLRSSIRDNRYKDQKLRLQRTGIKKIMYVVEGDPNACEGADSIKTACFTTEILEGFDVQRTSGLRETLHLYGFLTMAITDYYKLNSSADECETAGVCPKYTQFIKKCEDADKLTVTDVFATQLVQVPQVTEKVAMAVLECYPTLCSLAHAYAALDEDPLAQEELLMKKSEGAVNAVASKNIFRFVWGA